MSPMVLLALQNHSIKLGSPSNGDMCLPSSLQLMHTRICLLVELEQAMEHWSAGTQTNNLLSL